MNSQERQWTLLRTVNQGHLSCVDIIKLCQEYKQDCTQYYKFWRRHHSHLKRYKNRFFTNIDKPILCSNYSKEKKKNKHSKDESSDYEICAKFFNECKYYHLISKNYITKSYPLLNLKLLIEIWYIIWRLGGGDEDSVTGMDMSIEDSRIPHLLENLDINKNTLTLYGDAVNVDETVIRLKDHYLFCLEWIDELNIWVMLAVKSDNTSETLWEYNNVSFFLGIYAAMVDEVDLLNNLLYKMKRVKNVSTFWSEFGKPKELEKIFTPLLKAYKWRENNLDKNPNIPKKDIHFFDFPIYKDNKIVVTYKILKYMITKKYINVEMAYPDYRWQSFFIYM